MISLGYLTVEGRTQKAEIPAVRAAFPLGPRGWDGPHGWVALVLFVPPDGNLGRGDVDPDPALRVRVGWEPLQRGYHRRRDERRFRPGVHPVGRRVRSSRAAKAIPPHRIRWVGHRPARDGGEPNDVRILSRQPARRIPWRGEWPRGDRAPHGDIEPRGLAQPTRDHEPDDGDGLGRRFGTRSRLARHGSWIGRRRIDIDEVPVLDRRRARILRGPRGAIRDARGRGSRGPQGPPPGRRPSARRAGTLPPDAHRSLRGTTNGFRGEPSPASSSSVLVLRAPPLRRLHRILQFLSDFPLASVRLRQPG